MSAPEPARVPALALPPAALHDARSEPHPDSEEFAHNDKHRTAQELETIEGNGTSRSNSGHPPSPKASRSMPSPTLRSRGASRSSYRGLQPQTSETSTQPDSLGPAGHHETRYRLRRQVPHWYDPVAKFWKAHVSLTIDEGAHRDHLALERTFLGYLRTSLALAMTGVIIAQLFRLQHSETPNPELGYYVLGVPLAATFIAFGMVVLFIGAFRFWRQQNALARGKVHAGGWEITAIMAISILLCLAVFAITTAIDIEKSYT